MLHLGVCFLIFSFEVPSVGLIFLGYVGGLKKTVLPLWWLLRAC